MSEKKKCCKCGTSKPTTEFTRDKHRADGLNPRCRDCTRAACKKFHAENPDVAKARGARWVAANPERQRARNRAYYEANPEKMAAWHAEYNERNGDAMRAKAKAVRDANPEKERARAAAKYAADKAGALAKWARREALKLKATPVWANTARIATFYASADGLRMLLGEWYEVDHVVPLRSPLVCGLHNEFNLQILTREANRAKSNRTWPGMP